jgi:hypothetical protein
VGAAFGVDELGIDPHLIAGGLHRAFQQIAHAQLSAEDFGVDRFSLVGEGRAVRDHEAVAEARDSGGQLVGQGIGEVILRRIARKVSER